jgi:heat shock protein HslJ
MRTVKALSLAAALLLVPVLAACGGSASSGASVVAPVGPQPTGGADLSGTSWLLSGASSTTAPLTDSGITLEFTFNQARGNGGVNSYSATYAAHDDGRIKLGPIISTMVAGDPAKMKAEAAYLATLQKVTGYSVSGGLLDLFTGPDQVLTYAKK